MRSVVRSVAVLAALAATTSPQLLARVNTHGAKPCGSAVYGKYLYVANYGSGTLARVNPRTNKATKTIAVGAGPCGVVAGGGALWVENFTGSSIARVDPKRFRVTAHISVHGAPWDVAYGFGSVWTSNFRDETVSRINPRTRRIAKTIHTGGFPACIRTGVGSVWVGSQGTDEIYRIDPRTNAVTPIAIRRRRRLGVEREERERQQGEPGDETRAARSASTRHKVVVNLKAGAAPADGVRGPDGLEWIPNQDGTVTLIDPTADKVVDTIHHPGGITFVVRNGFGSLWVDDFTGSTLARYRPGS